MQQLQKRLFDNGLLEMCQSAYLKEYDMAVLGVLNDLWVKVDEKACLTG